MHSEEMIEPPVTLNGVMGLGDAEMHFVEVPLGEGAEVNLRKKFAISAQRKALKQLPQFLTDGTFDRGDLSRGEIHKVGVRRIYTHRFWTELQMNVLMPAHDGGEPKKAAFAGIMPAHNAYPGSSVLPIIDRDTIALVKQYRFHSSYSETLRDQGKGWRLEAPRGGRKPDESLEDCAWREASEEAGIKAGDKARVKLLGFHEPDSGILISSVALFAITGILVDPEVVHLDVTESPTETIILTVDRALDMIRDGAITCGITKANIMQALLAGDIRTQRSFT